MSVTLPFLERAMAVRGLTQQELAERSGVSRDTVSSAVRGGPITSRTFKRLIDALDLVPVRAIAHEVGAAVAEAPARVGGPGG